MKLYKHACSLLLSGANPILTS
uniref:Uncharacterized protein n=1 Tax=Arundo donax TaxID=35708 RepID=A0A0A9B7Z0_ARUDO